MQQNDELFFLACRMNAQLLKIYWCDIQSLGFDCLKNNFGISYTLYKAFYELFFFHSSIVINYLFNDIISSDRNNPEDVKESNSVFSHCFFPFVIYFLLREHQTGGSLPWLAPYSNTAGFPFVNLHAFCICNKTNCILWVMAAIPNVSLWMVIMLFRNDKFDLRHVNNLGKHA